jgi:hypothetical protein
MGIEDQAKAGVTRPNGDVLKPDRRHDGRRPVDTGAVLHLIDLGAKLHGRIVDLSLNGCSIRTEQRFSLGIFRRVETEFRLEGLAFRLAGVTQSVHDPWNIGIRFLNVSERKHDQLAALIEEIEESLARRQTRDANSPAEEPIPRADSEPRS